MNNPTVKLTVISLLATASMLSATVHAGELSANVGATSNYLWRGIEQTDGQAALSGGFDYSHQSGFYAGTWASNAGWAPGMTYELDLYGGFTGELSQALSYDVGYIYYTYPDQDSGDADFSEIYGNLSFSGFTLGLAVLADGEGADFGDTLYASADYEFTLSSELTMALHLGSYSGEWLAEDSVDYGVSVSKSGFTLGLADTGIQGSDVKVYLSYTVGLAM